VLGFPTLRDVIKKLDIISGTIYTIEGIVRKIFNRVDDISLSLTGLKTIQEKLNEILKKLEPDRSSLRISKNKIENLIIKGDIKSMNLDNLQQVTLTLEATDRKGNPAKVESVNWESTDTSIATAEPNTENQLECTFKAVKGAVGTCIARATADAKFGEETNNLVAEEALNVTDPEAQVLSLKVAEPVDQE